MQNEKPPSPDSLSVHVKKFLLEPPLLLEHFNYEDAQAFLKLGKEEHYMTGDIVIEEGEKPMKNFISTIRRRHQERAYSLREDEDMEWNQA